MVGQFQVPVSADGGWIAFGQGKSGLVTRAQDTTTGSFIALKIIPVTLREEDRLSVLHQLQELYASKHPCVADFFGADYFSERSCTLIAMEYFDLASFKDIMNNTGPIPEHVLGFACNEVLEGLRYLHGERRLIHRDIKPSNLLLNSRGQVKISDFGMSTQLANTLDPANTWVGSTTYMSPERISGLQYVGNSDIWSLGISFVELATGSYPYSSQPGQRLELVDLLDRIVDEEPPSVPQDSGFSADFHDFMCLCLKKRVEERPGATALQGHSFIQLHKGAQQVVPWLENVMRAAAAKTREVLTQRGPGS
eukprot:CAMPEP_0173392802 /NCGR_PEP_ID=MMETSP1356-20130122/21264_1 /TAXON_ID=77927 ORGANISM="Hemiselmis virescens, Strain PCC157" /NCGR_SAMPLE_ID=MMETSP1356 /ASSEMBLY_ACC=CAM_ASM_000847 /LENGTH=308 /DNA_ID=CAMNT_0014350707 /DNA_START=165 /DNA_END=1091 /DNA_ORIENTATION=+